MISHGRRAPSTARLRRGARRALASSAIALALACGAPPRSPDTVVIASGADLESANPLVTSHPLAKQVQRFALLVTLARYDSALVPEPYYARRWEWSEGGRVLTMHLASGLSWQDGVRTTARDAAFTLAAARDPATGYPRASDLASLDSAIAIDDSTLRLRYRVPQASLPAILAELPLVPQHSLATVPHADMRRAEFGATPIGNGPFRFASRRRGATWRFERNASFPGELGGPPALRAFTVAVVDEPTTKFAGLASGELDMAALSPAMAPLASRDATLRVVTYPVLFGTALFFNTTRPPFDDARVRRAVAHSIDRPRIVGVSLGGYARASTSAVPPDSPLAWTRAVAFDSSAADRALDDAGWRRGGDGVRSRAGHRLEVELLTVGSGDNITEQLIQGDLAARGVVVRVRQTELGAFLTAARAEDKRFDLLIAGVPGDLSLSYLPAMFASTQAGGTLDYTGFHAPSLDALLASATAAPQGSARESAWRAVQVMLDSLAPATWLYHSRGLQGISRRVTGVRMDLRGELVSIHDWSVIGERR